MNMDKSCDYYETNHFCKDKRQISKWEAKYEITKDSDSINSELTLKLHKIAKTEGFIDYQIHAKTRKPDGNNYLAIITDITIKGITQNGSKELDIFVKSIIPGDDIKIFEVGDLYDVEMYMYFELSRILNEFQNEAGVPTKERYNFVKCYDESDNQSILMENMTKKGFVLWRRTDAISFEFASKSIEALAKFHGLSLVLKEKRPKYFNEHVEKMAFPVKFNEEWEKFVINTCGSNLENLDGHSRSKFEKFIPSIMEKIKNYYNPDKTDDRCLCLCHGDFKIGNILMRERDGEIDIVPVDYQLIHYGSPITDLTYFIFTSTDGAFRKNHLDYLKNHYYDTMEKFVKYFDLCIEDLFPRKTYEEVFKERLDCGLVISSWALPIMLADNDEIIDLTTTILSDVVYSQNEKVKVRFQEVVNDFIEWGYL